MTDAPSLSEVRMPVRTCIFINDRASGIIPAEAAAIVPSSSSLDVK